jgi:hypothetical protein
MKNKLKEFIKTIISKKISKVRFYERDKSYEDFSISYTLTGEPICNFEILKIDEKIVVKKKDRRSTRHIVINPNFEMSLELVQKDKKKAKNLGKIICQSDIYYLDGSHRYKKENSGSTTIETV